MTKYLIPSEISKRILMVGVYYKNNAPGGMASVIQYYSDYFESLNYVASWKLTNKLYKAIIWASAYLKIMFKLIFNRNIRILHIHVATDASFWRKSMYANLGKRFGKKVILHMHGGDFKNFYYNNPRKNKILYNLQKCDKLIVLSSMWKTWYESIGIPGHKIEILNNIIAYPKETTKTDDGKKHLLFLGVISKEKGLFDLLEAIKDNATRFNNKIELRIGGNTNEKALLSFIRENHLDELVKFEGWVSGDKKAQLLQWADIFILPSYFECMPVSILEAMSYGCAVIATPVGGIPEIVIPKKNGLLVKPGDTTDIAQAISTLIENDDLINEYGNHSKTMVDPYMPSHVLSHLQNIYSTLLYNK